MITTERNVQYVFSILSRSSSGHDNVGSTVAILDTLHYQHGSLRNWYYTDDTTGEVLRRDRRECSKERILEVFGDGVPNGCPVAMYLHLCAPGWQVSAGKEGASSPARLLLGAESRRSSTYLSQHRQEEAAQMEKEDPDFMATNPSVLNAKSYCAEFSDDAFPIAVDYFDREKLEGFLETRDNKHDVLVQRFVDGGAVNDNFATIEAVWSPYQLYLNQRQSIVSVKQVDVPLQTRCHTFDNDALFNRPLRTTAQMRAKVKNECANIVKQIEQVEHKSVIRMVAYFSVTKDNAPVLLWVPELQMMEVPQQVAPSGASPPETPSKTLDANDEGVSPKKRSGKGNVDEIEEVEGSDTRVTANKMSMQRQRQLPLLSPPIVPSDVRLPADWKSQLASKHAKRAGTSPNHHNESTERGRRGAGAGGFDPTSRVTALKGIPRVGRRNIGFEGVAAMTATGGPTATLSHSAEIPTWIASAIAHKRNVDQQLAMLDSTFPMSKAAAAPSSQLDRQRRVASVLYGGGLGSRPQSRTGHSPVDLSLSPSPLQEDVHGGSKARSVLGTYNVLPAGANVAQQRAMSSNSHRPPLPIMQASVYHTNILGEQVAGAAKRSATPQKSPTPRMDYTTPFGFSIKGASMLLDPLAAAEEQRAQANRARDRSANSKRFYTAANSSANQFSHSFQGGQGNGQKGVLALTATRAGRGMQPARASSAQGFGATGGRLGIKKGGDISHNPSRSERDMVDRLVITPDDEEPLPVVGRVGQGSERPNSPKQGAEAGYWSDKERVYSRGGGGGYFVRRVRSAGLNSPQQHGRIGAHTSTPAPLDASAIAEGQGSSVGGEDRSLTHSPIRSGSPKSTRAMFGILSDTANGSMPSGAKRRLSSLAAQAQEARLGDSLRNVSVTSLGQQVSEGTPTAAAHHWRMQNSSSTEPATSGAVGPKPSTQVSINWNLVLEHAQHARWLALEREGDRGDGAAPRHRTNNSSKRAPSPAATTSPTRGLRLPTTNGSLGGDAPAPNSLTTDLHKFLWARAGSRSESVPQAVGLPSTSLLSAAPLSSNIDHPLIMAQAKHTRLSFDAFAPATLHEVGVLWDVDFHSESDPTSVDISWVESVRPPPTLRPQDAASLDSTQTSLQQTVRSSSIGDNQQQQLSTDHLALLDRSFLVSGGCNALVRRKYVPLPSASERGNLTVGKADTVLQKRLTVNLWDLFDPLLSLEGHGVVIKAHQRYLLGIESIMGKLQSDFYASARTAGGEFVECGNVPIEIPLVVSEGPTNEAQGDESVALLQFPPMLVPHILSALLQLLPQRKDAPLAKSYVEPYMAELRRLSSIDELPPQPDNKAAPSAEGARKIISQCQSRTEQLQQLGIECIQALLLVTPEEEQAEKERRAAMKALEPKGGDGPRLELPMSSSEGALAFKHACLTDLFDKMKGHAALSAGAATGLAAGRRKSSSAASAQMYPDVLSAPNSLTFLCHSSTTLHSALSALAHIANLIELSMVACEVHSLMDLGDKLQQQVGRLEELRKIRKVRVRKQEQEAQRAAAIAALQQQQGPHALPTGGLRAGGGFLSSNHLGTHKSSNRLSIPTLAPKSPSATELQVPPLGLFNPNARYAFEWPNAVFANRTVYSGGDALKGDSSAMASSQLAASNVSDKHHHAHNASKHTQAGAAPVVYDGEDDEPHLSATNLQFVALLIADKVRQRLEGASTSETMATLWPPKMVLF